MDNITPEQFNRVIEKPCLVQFSASWCGPCKIVTKTVESIEEQISIPVYKLDIELDPGIAKSLEIKSIPQLSVFDNETLKGTLIGTKSADEILELVKQNTRGEHAKTN